MTPLAAEGPPARRRRFLQSVLGGLSLPVAATFAEGAAADQTNAQAAPRRDDFAPVLPGVGLTFPADHGAHPGFRTEWWYLTGWLDRSAGRPACGFQITFFRSRTGHDSRNPSRFAPTQLILAHAALALPEQGRLLHDQSGARQGFGLAQAQTGDTRVTLDDWLLTRQPDDRYQANLQTTDFGLDLRFTPATAPVLQGQRGYSRKGPRPEQSSYYYSRPQLKVSGRVLPGRGPVTRGDTPIAEVVTGTAWLDHEWSSQVLDASASGWDWCGLNLNDGSALMAFAIRDRAHQPMWSHARWIDSNTASGKATATAATATTSTTTTAIGSPPPTTTAPASPVAGAPTVEESARFEPLRWWTSPRTGIRYPVAMRVHVGARQWDLSPLFDDQELDSRGSTGAIYWEGAVSVSQGGQSVGRGYLELTGYGDKLRL